MDNRHKLFNANSERLDQEGRLDSIQNMIKAPIANWLSRDSIRINLLQQIIKNSFSSDSNGYNDLPTAIKKMLQDPKHFLRTVKVDDPEKTMKTLVLQASQTAISEYIGSHPEYEEKLTKEIALKEESVKKTSQTPDEKMGKSSNVVPNASQLHHHPSDVVTKENPAPSRPKVR